MPLKAIVENLETVDETQRPFYREDDGKFVLDVEPVNGFALENIEGLKSALGATRRERDEIQQKFKSFDGLDAAKARDALTKLEELSRIDPEKEADKLAAQKLESLKSQMTDAHRREVEKLVKENSTFKGVALRFGVTDRISKALDAAKAMPDSRPVLEAYMSKYVKSSFDDNGTLSIQIVDDNGNPRIADAQGNPMKIEDLAIELRSKMPQAFEGKGAGGSGASPGGDPSGGGTVKKRSEMSNDEKAKYLAKNGYEKFMALPY